MLREVWDMGEFVLSDYVGCGEQDTAKYPMVLCLDEWGRVRLRDVVPKDLLFRRYYYESGLNEAMALHLDGVVKSAIEYVALEKGDYVVDIGSNDGTLLGSYGKLNVVKVGFDPSDIPVRAGTHDVRVNDYFSVDGYRFSAGMRGAKVVTSIAMFYDLEDAEGFVRQVDSIMDDDGIWVVEMHYLRTMLESNGFDAICHEHLFYYDLTSFEGVLERSGTGMKVVGLEMNGVNGGSFRVYVRRGSTSWSLETEPELLKEVRKRERDSVPLEGLLEGFRLRCEDNREQIRLFFEVMAGAKKRVWGYGASTKGSTMAQYWGLDSEWMEAIADRNERKVGKVTTGTRIPIKTEYEMRRVQPDYLLIFPYHFLDGFMQRESGYLERGGQFVVPMPYLRFVVRSGD